MHTGIYALCSVCAERIELLKKRDRPTAFNAKLEEFYVAATHFELGGTLCPGSLHTPTFPVTTLPLSNADHAAAGDRRSASA